jgi:hypothetical protein
LFVLIVYAHHLLGLAKLILLAQGSQTGPSRHICMCRTATQRYGYLLQPQTIHDAIDVFDTILFAGTPVHCEVVSLRPASRDIIRQRAVRQR